MKKKLVGSLALGAALALTACSTAPSASNAPSTDGEKAETVQVSMGYIADYAGASLAAVADAQDLWAQHGIEIKAQPFTNGPLAIQALGTGDLDIAYIGPGALWLPASGKATVVALNTVGEADRVIAQAGIDSIEDLKGKSVAVPEGTSGDMILTLALKEAGMTKDDITVVPMDAATVVTAFASKQVDAAGIWYPSINTIKKQVPDMVELASSSDFTDIMSFPSAYVAGNDVVKNDPEKIERVLQVVREANQWRYDNQDEAVEITAKFMKVAADQVASDMEYVGLFTTAELDGLIEDGTAQTWLTAMNEYFISAGKLAEADAIDPVDYFASDLFLSAGE